MRSLNTQNVIQIHPAHNFVSFGRFGMYVVPNERPTLWLSFCVFYVWKYEVPHPVKIEEYFWWERALNYKICYEAIDEINWVQISALILLQSPEIPRGTKWDGRVTVAGVSMRWRVLERFFLRTSGIVIFEQSRSPIPAECAINSIPVTFGVREYSWYYKCYRPHDAARFGVLSACVM